MTMPYADLLLEIEQLRRERDKLRRERDELKADLTSKNPMHMDSAGRWEAAAMRYAHERDWLTRELAEWKDSAALANTVRDKFHAENDRLRAALMDAFHITNAILNKDQYLTAVDNILSRALFPHIYERGEGDHDPLASKDHDEAREALRGEK